MIYKKYFNQAALEKITEEAGLAAAGKRAESAADLAGIEEYMDLFKINKPAYNLAQKLRKKYKTILLAKIPEPAGGHEKGFLNC